MKSFLLFVCAWLCAFSAHAQYSKIIESDRPGEGRSAFVQSFMSFQAEIGFRKIRNDDNNVEYWHPAFSLRYGITNWLEGRLESNVVTEKMDGHSTTGLNPVKIGAKALITQGEKWLPHISLLAETGLPFLASGPFQPPHLSPDVRVIFENDVTDAFVLNYNTGVEWDGFDTHPQYMYSFSPQVTVAEKVELFAEVYGFLKQHESPETTIDGGASYFISNNMKLDLSAGWGLSKMAPEHFYALGFSARIK